MLTQAEFEAILQRYLDGRSQPGEAQLVEKWSEQLGLEENLVLSLDQHEEVRAAMWHKIVALTGGESTPELVQEEAPVLSRPLAFWQQPVVRWAAAALLVLGVGLGWWLPQRQAQVAATIASQWVVKTNRIQQQQDLVLADGSRVTLYPGSTLKYRAGLTGGRREVLLMGQAYFKVAKNPARPFLVYTDKVVTTVLGTSFLVTAYTGKAAKVAVREGKVAVQARHGARLDATPAQPAVNGVVLLPNQQVVYTDENHSLDKILVEEPVLLVPHPLEFKKRPVPEVLAALEKAYGVNIVYDPSRLRECTITIAFDNESLFEQLDVLCKALNAKYKLANNAQIIFESNGCKSTY
ncbi:FecR domain-containing protein [uncultured Hymenobacter sp.]|uniref:FecR domain-containing protein n=1 Tax=uncultured Hymenobacter sp. TaxID=170016 RepID=UPI0035CC096C